jgi:hypothetical protein
MQEIVSVIYVSDPLPRFKAGEFAKSNPDLKVIESRGGKKRKHIRSRFTFVKIVPEGHVCLHSRVSRIPMEWIKEIM